MKILLKLLFVFIISITSMSCSSLMQAQRDWNKKKNSSYRYKTDEQLIRETRDSWIGRKEHEVYSHSHWGVPENKVSDGKGGIMISYSRKSTKANPYVVGEIFYVVYITTFYIDSSHTIYDMKVRMERL